MLKVKGGSPGRRQIATRRGQQLDAAIRARLPIQKEMLFRINRPTKMAVSDRPNAWVVLYSLVLSTCAIAHSFVVVMSPISLWISTLVFSRKKLKRR